MAADLVILPGAPGRIRTRDPLLRRQLLYPAELQAPTERIVQDLGHAEATAWVSSGFVTCPRPETRGQQDQQRTGVGVSGLPGGEAAETLGHPEQQAQQAGENQSRPGQPIGEDR